MGKAKEDGSRGRAEEKRGREREKMDEGEDEGE